MRKEVIKILVMANPSQFQNYFLCDNDIDAALACVDEHIQLQAHKDYYWANSAFIDRLGGLVGPKPITKLGLYTTHQHHHR